MSTTTQEHHWYDGLTGIWDSAVSGFNSLKTSFSDAVSGVTEWGETLVTSARESINGVIEKGQEVIDSVKQGIEDNSWAITHPFQSLTYAFTEAVLGTETAYNLSGWVKEHAYDEASSTLLGSENLGEGINRWQNHMREDLIAQGKLPQPSAAPA